MKKRVISAIIAILIVVPFIYFGGISYTLFASVLGIIGYKEVLDLKKFNKKIPSFIKILGLISLCYLMLVNNNIYSFNYRNVILPLLLILLPSVFYKENKYSLNDGISLLGFIYLIGISFNLIINIRLLDLNLFIYLISITVITDTFAYLVGTLIGKHKMSPKISPKKSWEGFIGGLLGGTIISLIVYNNLVSNVTIGIVFLTIFLTIVGQVGDLVFSKIKRENKIKDFSNLMPGHGGLLDRLDSFIIVVLTYSFIVLVV